MQKDRCTLNSMSFLCLRLHAGRLTCLKVCKSTVSHVVLLQLCLTNITIYPHVTPGIAVGAFCTRISADVICQSRGRVAKYDMLPSTASYSL